MSRSLKDNIDTNNNNSNNHNGHSNINLHNNNSNIGLRCMVMMHNNSIPMIRSQFVKTHVPIGSEVVPFCGLYLESHKVIPKRNY